MSAALPPTEATRRATREMLDSPELRRLVARRWTISLSLLGVLFVAYYGLVLLVALDPDLLARRVGAVTTLGIPLAAGVIVVAWAVTAIYVRWANRVYDPEVDRLRARLDAGGSYGEPLGSAPVGGTASARKGE